jgi:hypothetical protein
VDCKGIHSSDTKRCLTGHFCRELEDRCILGSGTHTCISTSTSNSRGAGGNTMVDQCIYRRMERKLPAFLGRLDGPFRFRHWSNNGNTYQIAYCRNKIGAAWFQSSASHDSPDKFCTTYTSVIYDGCLCHNRLFISDACSAEVLRNMGTARSNWSVRIYCLGIYAGSSWLSEYPCRNWLVETIGRTTTPPSFLL